MAILYIIAMAKFNYRMRYVLIIISIILIIYPIIAIIKCLESIDTLSSYGAGVLVGGLLLLFAGILILVYTLRSIKLNKKRKNHE